MCRENPQLRRDHGNCERCRSCGANVTPQLRRAPGPLRRAGAALNWINDSGIMPDSSLPPPSYLPLPFYILPPLSAHLPPPSFLPSSLPLLSSLLPRS